MKKGRVNSALNLLSQDTYHGILPLDELTIKLLHVKHPVSSTALSIREICEQIWTSRIREIRKIFRNGPSAKLNPRESVKISRME